MKVCFVLGTRPEIIKMSPIIRELEAKNINYFILHTGQHYDFLMDEVFFKELGLKPELSNLDVGSGTHGEVTGKMIIGIEKIMTKEKPDVVLVEGDTNSVLAGALVATKLHIPVGHVEAGLRSFDRRMPEEYNRVITDHISDYLFAPTKASEKNLRDEGIGRKEILYYNKLFTPKIFLTGNTIVDAVHENLERAHKNSKIQNHLDLKNQEYFLVTAHREENVDYEERLLGIIKGLHRVHEEHRLPIIYPIHPRTKKRLQEFNLLDKAREIKGLKLIEPVGFLDLLKLQANAKLILTDSGGLQEESCSLKVPCVVLRDTSDRPESIEVGASVLAGCEPKKILECTKEMLNRKKDWNNPFGDGTAGKKIISILHEYIK